MIKVIFSISKISILLILLKKLFKNERSLTNPVVKDEQTPFVNRKADGSSEAKATNGSGYVNYIIWKG